MGVASSQLAVGSIGSATVTTVFTAPATKRTIVKNIIVRNAGAAGAVAVNVNKFGGGGATFNIWCAGSGSSGDTVNFNPWIVLNPGDVLQLAYPAAAGGWYAISGTELVL